MKEYFGGLPVMILFGDDYQLVPIEGRAINRFVNYKNKNPKGTLGTVFVTNCKKLVLKRRGKILYREHLTEIVFELTKNPRSFKCFLSLQSTSSVLRHNPRVVSFEGIIKF